MRQLETIVGRRRVPRRPARVPASSYQFGNASWPDLIALLDARTPRGSRRLEPRLGRGSRTADHHDRAGDRRGPHRDGSRSRSRDPYPRRGLTWTEDMQVALGYADRVAAGARPADRRAHRGRAPRAACRRRCSCCRTAAASATANSISTRRAWRGCRAHLPEIDDALTRGSAWVTLWDALLDARTAAAALARSRARRAASARPTS